MSYIISISLFISYLFTKQIELVFASALFMIASGLHSISNRLNEFRILKWNKVDIKNK